MLEETKKGQEKRGIHTGYRIAADWESIDCFRSLSSLLISEMTRDCYCLMVYKKIDLGFRSTRTIQSSFSSFATMKKLFPGKFTHLSFSYHCWILSSLFFPIFSFLRIKINFSVRSIVRTRREDKSSKLMIVF